MVKRGGELNGSLKKNFVRAPGMEPERFPGLMRDEVIAAIELLDTSDKFVAQSGSPVGPCYNKNTSILFRRLTEGRRLAMMGTGSPDMEICISLGAVRLALLEADSVRSRQADPTLTEEMSSVAGRLARNLTVESVAELEPVRAVRAMFRSWGLDPSKYRPSAEALLRRIAQGKGLYHILNVVDIVNLAQIETGWPFGLYDRDRLRPPITFRLGKPEEKYEGIGRRVWHLHDRPVLADAEGPFGSPISDSTRTRITEETRAIAAVIFAPSSAREAAIEVALERLTERLQLWAAAEGISSGILPARAQGDL